VQHCAGNFSKQLDFQKIARYLSSTIFQLDTAYTSCYCIFNQSLNIFTSFQVREKLGVSCGDESFTKNNRKDSCYLKKIFS
jgi:hypothetical protein